MQKSPSNTPKDLLRALKSAPSLSGSSKRGRTVDGSTQSVSCSVDGLDSDLSDCKEYHRRHRVCEKPSINRITTFLSTISPFGQEGQ
ncbi:hypothetical protein K1719_016295 [Acacia pycnantha]|nr:hypothetical protein K1719_016295 [Acacia pycnantha]